MVSRPRPGDVDRHFADISKANRLLGFAPTTSIETGLARTVEWFRDHHSGWNHSRLLISSELEACSTDG